MIPDIIVLIEDHRFWKHRGVDLIATMRALLVNLREKRYAQGGSTITQQLARTLYLSPRKTLLRKLRELMLAFWIELTMSKQQILRLYMSAVYLGHRPNGTPIRGFRQASIHWFNKLPRNLTVAEQASLVAMLKGPNIYHPRSQRGIARTLFVLFRMMDQRLISRDQLVRSFVEFDGKSATGEKL